MPDASQRSTVPSHAKTSEPSGRSLRTRMALSIDSTRSDLLAFGDQRVKTGLVEDGRLELLCLGEFRAGVFARDEVAGLLRYRIAHHAAQFLDALLDLAAGVVLESTRHHQRQSGQWAAGAGRRLDHVHPSLDQLVDD